MHMDWPDTPDAGVHMEAAPFVDLKCWRMVRRNPVTRIDMPVYCDSHKQALPHSYSAQSMCYSKLQLAGSLRTTWLGGYLRMGYLRDCRSQKVVLCIELASKS